jgi:transcriptional regulator with XRE-family HTH domain
VSIALYREDADSLPVGDRNAGERLKVAIHVARARAEPPITSDMQLAVQAGIHYDTLMNWYSGRTLPRPGGLRQVADALGIRYSDLQDAYDGRDPEPPTLVEAIEALIDELRLSRAQQDESTLAILRALGALLPEVLVPRGRPAHSEPDTHRGTRPG